MYEGFYGLRERPFNLTPDPRYLYLSDKHKEAFAHLLYGIKNRTGFVMVSGEVGTGKTTICRTLLRQLDPQTEVAFIFNPALSPDDLLRKINEDFGIESRADSLRGLVDELNAYLLDRNAKGYKCVLVIDEAQNLPPAILEHIRLLSNLETETEKLLQIVLIGQPELADHLALPELRQLNQRITARYHLMPLGRDETTQYIAYRLQVAGGRKRVEFTPGALKAIYRHTQGVPRLINSICDRALLIGYTEETRMMTRPIVERAAKEIRGERPGALAHGSALRRRPVWPWAMGGAAAAAAVLLAGFGLALGAPAIADWTRSLARADATAPAEEATPSIRPGADRAPARNDGTVRAEPAALTAADEPPGETDDLAGLTPRVAREAGAQAILRRWNLAPLGSLPDDDSTDGLAAFAEQNGLRFEPLSPTLEQLVAIDLPALVRVAHVAGPMWVAVLGVVDEGIEVATDYGEVAVVPWEQLEGRYLGKAALFWRGAEGGQPVITRGMRGEAVRDLQARLARFGLFDDAISGEYDIATRAAVIRMQMETGLDPDGKVGDQTRMVLASWSPDIPTPSLLYGAAAERTGAAPPVEASGPQVAVEPAGAPADAPPAVTAETPPPALPEASAPAAMTAESPPAATVPQPPAEGAPEVAAEWPEASADATAALSADRVRDEAVAEASAEPVADEAASAVDSPGNGAPPMAPLTSDTGESPLVRMLDLEDLASNAEPVMRGATAPAPAGSPLVPSASADRPAGESGS